ncbi:hypothetical protein C8R34_1536 [Nitrosomonas sp. Nm84]|nr:hypothetical protein C8R34_1536 [Nitrosomonas sp. Nm84]
MLAFYDYPAENWQHIRTINPVESVFAAVVRLRGYKLLADVIQGIKFINGVKKNGDQKQRAD